MQFLVCLLFFLGIGLSFCEKRIHEHWNGCGVVKSVTMESHFIQSYHWSSNRLEVTKKHWVNSYSFVILPVMFVVKSQGSSGHSISIHRISFINMYIVLLLHSSIWSNNIRFKYYKKIAIPSTLLHTQSI